MCRICSSCKTVSDSPSQSLTARKSIALSETAPSQSASYSLKNAFFDFLNMFYTTILLANFFLFLLFDTLFKRILQLAVRRIFYFFAKVYSAK